MPVARFEMPDGRIARFEVPDGTTPEQAQEMFSQYVRAGQGDMSPSGQARQQYDPTEGMTTFEKTAAGAGKAIVDLGRGARKILSNVPVLNQMDTFNPEMVQRDIDESRVMDAPLMNTTAGQVGNVAGLVGAGMLVPGAATAAGATALGAGIGALQPTAQDESIIENAAIGAVAGRAGKWIGDKVGAWLGNRLAQKTTQVAEQKAANQVKEATLRAGQDEGLVVTPSQAGAGRVSRFAEGLSGKAKTEQLAVIRNQEKFDGLARRALGLPNDAPLTSEAMQALRNQAYKSGYEPVKSVGIVSTDGKFNSALDGIVRKYSGATRSFPGSAKNEVSDVVEAFRVKYFDAGDALDAMKILREDAAQAFRSGNNALGIAQRKIAAALEDKIERQLMAQGKDGQALLKSFRDARTLMAKSHAVEEAIVEGAGTVDPQKFARMLQRGDKLTGELKTMAEFANTFKKVSRVPESGYSVPLTVTDAGFAGLALGVSPYAAALPAARVGARYGILSGPYQSAFVQPTYSSNSLASLMSGSVNNRLVQSSLPSVASGVTLNRRKE